MLFFTWSHSARRICGCDTVGSQERGEKKRRERIRDLSFLPSGEVGWSEGRQEEKNEKTPRASQKDGDGSIEIRCDQRPVSKKIEQLNVESSSGLTLAIFDVFKRFYSSVTIFRYFCGNEL